MRLLLDSFWRSAAYCLHPRVIALSFLPVMVMAVLSFALGYWYWDSAVLGVMAWLDEWGLVKFVLGWLSALGLGSLQAVLAPLLVLALATPVIVALALLFVGLFMTPAMVDLVAQRRFAQMERRRGASVWAGVAWSVWSTVLALLALALSIPLWLVPPLVLVLPPLIWGWLTYRVFAFDALADHASIDERKALLAQHRVNLLIMGVACGFLGAAPSVLWASGAMFVAMAPLLVPLAVWLYALVFAFSSLWFAHFLLAALDQRRRAASAAKPPAPAVASAPASAAGVTDVKPRPAS